MLIMVMAWTGARMPETVLMKSCVPPPNWSHT
jgi:hypothetical protein